MSSVLESVSDLKTKVEQLSIHQIEKVDLQKLEEEKQHEMEQLNEQMKAIDGIIEEMQKWADRKSFDSDDNAMVTDEMNDHLTQLNQLISNIRFIKENENVTDVAQKLNGNKSQMPSVEFVDDINANIRKRKPF
jgi:predicted nuclease with TOPRIM domain